MMLKGSVKLPAEVDGEALDYYTPDKFVYTISFAEGQ